MPVFLSHKREDEHRAKQIAEHLKRRGVHGYLDVLDPSLSTSKDITQILIDRISDCTHLMAILSTSTARSWWVPFEIGVATQSDKRITSFQLPGATLPDYLTKWPIIKSQDHLDKFIALYKRDQKGKPTSGALLTFQRDISTAEEFHRTLKSSIGQHS